MSGIISWEDPPGRSGAGAALAAVVKEVRARPGEWAKVAENASLQDAEKFRTGLRREPGFEVKRRATIDGHDVYIRYNPEYKIDRSLSEFVEAQANTPQKPSERTKPGEQMNSGGMGVGPNAGVS